MRFQRADFGFSLTLGLCAALAGLATAQEPTQPQTIRDLLWVWGNPEMAQPRERQEPIIMRRLSRVHHVGKLFQGGLS